MLLSASLPSISFSPHCSLPPPSRLGCPRAKRSRYARCLVLRDAGARAFSLGPNTRAACVILHYVIVLRTSPVLTLRPYMALPCAAGFLGSDGWMPGDYGALESAWTLDGRPTYTQFIIQRQRFDGSDTRTHALASQATGRPTAPCSIPRLARRPLAPSTKRVRA